MRCARESKISIRTISLWWSQPDFADYVLAIREEVRESLEPAVQHTMQLAVLVTNEALEGKRDASSAAVLLAERILARTVYRLLVMAARNATTGQYIREDPANSGIKLLN